MAPLLIGAVVGCLIFYFIRRYNKFTPSMLVATIAAILGGDRDLLARHDGRTLRQP